MRKLAYGAFGSAAAATLLLGAAGAAAASSDAEGVAANSAGVISGNQIQIPVHVPVNLCGNTVDIIAALNPAFGNTCVNGG